MSPPPSPAAEATGTRPVYRRMRLNVAWLLGGKGFGGVASLIYLAVAARALGPAQFGLFSLVLAYGQAIANLMQFQSWQAVIRYGAQHRADGEPGRLARVIGFTTTLDIGSAVLGAATAWLGVTVAGPWLGWSPVEQRDAAAFGAALLLSIGATPNGVLRLFDRFDLLTYCQAIGPSVRVVGSVMAWWLGGGVPEFLGVWAAAALIQSAVTWVVALGPRERRPVLGHAAFTQAVAENRRIWRFSWMTNLSSSLSIFGEQASTLAVGGVVGTSTAGGYRLASRLAKGLVKPVQAMARVLYPEMARLVATDDRRTLARIAGRVELVTAGLAVVVIAAFAVGGGTALTLLAGPAYASVEMLLFLLAVAAAIDLSGLGLEPVLNAHGKAGKVLAGRAAGAVINLGLLAALLPVLGAEGAAVAAIAGSLTVRVWLGLSTRQLLRRQAALP